jgi:MFS family permease
LTRPTLLFLAFAFGYFFSALLRAVTATLAPQFSAELGLGAADLGLLAGVFFAGFASTQLPLGAALDRIGPKRVLVFMMGVAVLACAAFATAQSFEALLVARALMGVGLSAGLMAALTSFRHAYSPEMQLRASSWMLMTGSLGMLMSTVPVHALLPWVGWRGLFWLSAAGIAACAAFIWWVVPADVRCEPSVASGSAGQGYVHIFRHPTFLRLAPMGFWHYGGLVAVQALWAGPWFNQVNGLDAAASARGLFWVNLAMLVSFASLGALVPRLSARGWNAERLIRWTSPISTALLLAVVALGPAAGPPILALWCVSCVLLSLSQPAVGQAFEARLVGRALSAFNLLIFLGVFSAQWGLGLIIDALLAQGWATVSAFQGAFGVLAAGCVLCYLWFLWAGSARVQALAGPAQPKRAE